MNSKEIIEKAKRILKENNIPFREVRGVTFIGKDYKYQTAIHLEIPNNYEEKIND